MAIALRIENADSTESVGHFASNSDRRSTANRSPSQHVSQIKNLANVSAVMHAHYPPLPPASQFFPDAPAALEEIESQGFLLLAGYFIFVSDDQTWYINPVGGGGLLGGRPTLALLKKVLDALTLGLMIGPFFCAQSAEGKQV